MKTRSIVVLLSAVVVVGISVQPSAEQNPAPPPPLWFDGGPPAGTPPNHFGLVPSPAFEPDTTTPSLLGANNCLYGLDLRTGQLSQSPLQVYSGPPGPLNFAVTHINGRRVIWTAPGGPSNNPLAAFVYGPPHELLGDFGMIDGGQQFGVNVAAGDVIADSIPELFYTLAGGGSGEVFKISPVSGSEFRFRPIAGYEGPVRLATGDINKDGYDELAVSPVNRPDVHFYTFRDSGPVFIGRVTPFPGSPNGPFVDLFDVTNDGRDEILFGSPPAPGDGGARVKILSYVNRDYLDLLADFPVSGRGASGVGVTGSVINGQPAVIASVQNVGNDEITVLLYEFKRDLDRYIEQRTGVRLGSAQTPADLFIEAFFPPPPPR